VATSTEEITIRVAPEAAQAYRAATEQEYGPSLLGFAEEDLVREIRRRAALVLTLGIMGLVLSICPYFGWMLANNMMLGNRELIIVGPALYVCPLVGWMHGSFAMLLSRIAQLEMARGKSDRYGRRMLQAGWVLGLIASLLFLLLLCLAFFCAWRLDLGNYLSTP